MADEVKDTGWQKVRPDGTVVDRRTDEALGAVGHVDMVTGLEKRPCCMCVHFEDTDPDRLVRHLISRGLRPRPDGKFESPIKDDFAGQTRANLTLDPKGAGYCRAQCIVVEGLATCEEWKPTKTISEFQQRMLRRAR